MQNQNCSSSGDKSKKKKQVMGSSSWNYRMFLCFTRKFKLSEVDPPAGVKDAFKKYSEGGSHMTADQLRRFLVEVQKEDQATTTDAVNQIQHILEKRHNITKFTRHTLTVDDFFHLLFSVDLNPPIHSKVHNDMTAPLSHYFVYTGHNSYLTGNQLTSDCSEVPIIKALQKGVRVIELDLWPNSSKDKVQVLHGRTVTAPVELPRCLKAIKEHAFVASPYPVIITLEDHLTTDLQAKVAQMITQTFGDMLFCPESDSVDELPSPVDLKHRIMISTKPPKEYLEEAKSYNERRSTSGKGKDSDEDLWGKEPSSSIADLHDNNKGDQSDRHINDSIVEEEEEDESNQNANIAPVYRKLISINAGKPKGGLHIALKVEPNKVRRLSLSEQGLEKAIHSHGMDVVRFTQKNILRIYPKGTRVTSSNYKPMVGWMHGAQMVAFNMQGYGRSLWIMQGMFRANGGCGYVKKPDYLMKIGPNGQVFDPKEKLPVKKTLKVTVYMGDGWHLDFKQTHFDAYSPPDFYARVGIAGVPADQIMKKTKTKEDNWTPVWEEAFVFPLTVPELALLRIEVHEYDISEKDDFGGQTCLPVSELRPGIHAVPLCNRKGEKFNSVRLLMLFEFV